MVKGSTALYRITGWVHTWQAGKRHKRFTFADAVTSAECSLDRPSFGPRDLARRTRWTLTDECGAPDCLVSTLQSLLYAREHLALVHVKELQSVERARARTPPGYRPGPREARPQTTVFTSA